MYGPSIFRNVLLANNDTESVVPDIQQLSHLIEFVMNSILITRVSFKFLVLTKIMLMENNFSGRITTQYFYLLKFGVPKPPKLYCIFKIINAFKLIIH